MRERHPDAIPASEVAAIRNDFPVFRHRAFLDTACYAPGYQRAADAVNAWWQTAMLIPGTTFDQTLAWLRPAAAARSDAARLLQADEDEVGFITSTALGMNKIANALALGGGNNIVINDLEFPANTVPWLGQRRRGVEIRRVEHRAGRLLIDDFEKLVDHNTRVIAVSTVQWTTGFRINLKSLVELADAYGAYVVVDSCQSLGALELDVRKTNIHFMVTQAHKWLFGPFATGLIYCRRDLIENLAPVDVETGNLLKDPERQPYHHLQDLDNIADYDHGFVPTAARVQTCPNLPGLWGLSESLRCINGVGIARIETRVHELVDYLLEKLVDVPGVTIVSSVVPDERSALIVVSTGDVERDVRMMNKLSELGVGVSVRYQAGSGGIRISCHFYNSEDDIDKLIAAMSGRTPPLYFH